MRGVAVMVNVTAMLPKAPLPFGVLPTSGSTGMTDCLKFFRSPVGQLADLLWSVRLYI